MPEPIQPTLDLDGRLAGDVPCAQCEYLLRGMLPQGNCPECGCSVADSLEALARKISPGWLRVLIAILLFNLSMSVVNELMRRIESFFDSLNGWVLWTVSQTTVLGLMIWLSFCAKPKNFNPRWLARAHVLRAASVVNLIAFAVVGIVYWRAFFGSGNVSTFDLVMATYAYSCCASWLALIFWFHVTQMMEQIVPKRLAQATVIYMAIVAIACLVLLVLNIWERRTQSVIFSAPMLEWIQWVDGFLSYATRGATLINLYFLVKAIQEWRRQRRFRNALR